jgi:hypothetical protein
MITKKEKLRTYRLHCQLKKRDNVVDGRTRMIIKRAKQVTPIEQKYMAELISLSYCVFDDLFAE